MSNHSFDIKMAAEYKSIEIAILIWHFKYWIDANKRLGRNLHEGRTWTYQTLIEITAVFPYWTKRQVEKYINKAVELKILRKGNFNKSRFDRTVWYAFEDEAKFLFPESIEIEDLKSMSSGISPNGEMDSTKRRNPSHQAVTPIPDTLPNTITDKEMSEQSFGPITNFLFEHLKGINPKLKTPNLKKWAIEMKRLIENDGRTEEEVKQIILYIVNQHHHPSSNFTWSQAVISPEKLRKHFATIWLEINKKKPETDQEDLAEAKVKLIKENHEWFHNDIFVPTYDKLEKLPHIVIRVTESCVYLEDKQRRINTVIGYGENGFKTIIHNFFRSRKLV